MNNIKFDVVIQNGRLVFKDKVIKGGVAIQGEKIVRILKENEHIFCEEIIDAKGHYIIPGLIDSHVHFRTPGLTHKENWIMATRAAAAGGITTVLDMPNTNPYLTSIKDIAYKSSLISGQSLVDYGFHLGVKPGAIKDLHSLDPTKIASIKVFLAGHNTAHNVITDMDELEEIFKIAAKKDVLLTFHAEDEKTFHLSRNLNREPRDLKEYERTVTRAGGIVAISNLINLTKKHGTKIHILHVSSKEEVDLLEGAIQEGHSISFETTPHHLYFNLVNDLYLGTKIKLSPAIRTIDDQNRLWKAIKDRIIKVVGSDHAPHTMEEKNQSFWDAPPGLPGVQEMCSVIVTGLSMQFPQMSQDEIMMYIVNLLAEGPANLFNINHNKGSLTPGHDADIVIYNPKHTWYVKKESIYSLCGWSAYENRLLKGAPIVTVSRGNIVYKEGQFGNPQGKMVGFKNEKNEFAKHSLPLKKM
jgi:dihydroorotase